LILSPITTFIGDNDALREQLTNQGFENITTIKGFSGNYINNNNVRLTKLAQILYVILRDKKVTATFKEELKSSKNTNINDISELFTMAKKVINESSNIDEVKEASKALLNSVENYNGPSNGIESNIIAEKEALINAIGSGDKPVTGGTGGTTGGEDTVIKKVPTLENFTKSIAENISSGTNIGKIDFKNGGSAITSFTLSDNTNFEIDNSGVIKTKTTFDYEKEKSYSFTLFANNGVGKSKVVNFNVTITDIADIVPTLKAYSSIINDDITLGTEIGKISFDVGDSSITSFTLSENTNFEIDNSGAIKTKSIFDFDKKSSYSLTLFANNGAGKSNTVNFNITIKKVISGTPVLENFTAAIAEGDGIGRSVGQVKVNTNGNTAITGYSLDGSGSEKFKIDNNGNITTKEALDYESAISHSFNVFATNGAGDGKVAKVTINISNIEDVPPTLNAFSGVIDEGDTLDRSVGNIIVSKKGHSAITGYTLSGTTKFQINNTGLITTKEALDFEGTTTYFFSVKATNGAGAGNEVSVAINITNVAETAPTLNNFEKSIAEGNTLNRTVGKVEVSMVEIPLLQNIL
jgi:hypothetical protein